MDNLDEFWHDKTMSSARNGDGCVTGGRPGLQTRACGTNTVVDRFDSYTSPPTCIGKNSLTVQLN